jgi:hypothetical protein
VGAPLASDPTAMICGEKIVGDAELGQVKAAHWKVEFAEAGTISARLVGTLQSRFRETYLKKEVGMSLISKPILFGHTHRAIRRERSEKAPMATDVIWLEGRYLEVLYEASKKKKTI